MIGWDISRQARELEERYPQLRGCVDATRVEELQKQADGHKLPDDFGASAEGGRGESYIAAQQSTSTRAQGIGRLLDLFLRHGTAESDVVLDLLGGDGLLQRVHSLLGLEKPMIVTCDASPFMVEAAWAKGIPAILQRAEASVFRTGSVGGVLLAYGSHHIPPARRGTVATEAFRVLQPGGVFALHDFLSGSPVDTWFTKVVDVYSETGHAHSHFDEDTTRAYFQSAGFQRVELFQMDDPFVVEGDDPRHAELELGRYLVEMYGLVRLAEENGQTGGYRRAYELACEIFRYPQRNQATQEVHTSFSGMTGKWSVTMPREALVAHGRKPRLAEH